jgi:hypothetical protein
MCIHIRSGFGDLCDLVESGCSNTANMTDVEAYEYAKDNAKTIKLEGPESNPANPHNCMPDSTDLP